MLSRSYRETLCRTLVLLSLVGGVSWYSQVDAVEPPIGDASQESAAKSPGALATTQDAISMRFKRFEKTLLQMAEYLRKTDPARADLLIRVIGRSQEDQIAQQMEQVVSLLESRRLGDAADRQTDVLTHLKSLLALLQSEDRLSELDREKERIKDLLKDLDKLIAREKDVRVATERRENPGRLIERQERVAGDAGRLVDKIDTQDAEHNGDAEPPNKPEDDQGNSPEQTPSEQDASQGEPAESKPSDGESKESKPADGKPKEAKPSDGESKESKPSEGKPSESKPSEGESKPSEGSSSPQTPSESSPPQQSPQGESQRTPGRDEVEQAKRELEKAIEELKRRRLDNASEHQDDAIAKLQEAKEKLEEILRQLREEERELLLAGLEARFQKMLAQQLVVYEATKKLDATPRTEWGSRHFSRTRELAGQEDDISLEAARALALLREEGSSVAFPEALEQLQEDMRIVARRLGESEVGELTQGIESDIIEALEELIEALQREMEKKGDQPPGAQQNGQGQPPEFALVDKLAELKMLRSLQMRVNRRTRRLGSMVGESDDDGIHNQLRELSDRQARIQSATYDLSIGRNR